MGLKSFQNDIRGYLKDDIWYKEHGQRGVVLISGQIDILDQPKNSCIRNVRAIEKSQKVEDAQNWNDAEIDLSEKLSLVDT